MMLKTSPTFLPNSVTPVSTSQAYTISRILFRTSSPENSIERCDIFDSDQYAIRESRSRRVPIVVPDVTEVGFSAHPNPMVLFGVRVHVGLRLCRGVRRRRDLDDHLVISSSAANHAG